MESQESAEVVMKVKKILEVIWIRGNEAQKLFLEGNYNEAQNFLSKRWQAFLNLRAFFHKHQNLLQPWLSQPGPDSDLWHKISQQDKVLLGQLRGIRQKTRINLAKSRDYLVTIQHYKTGFHRNKFIKLV